MFSDLTSLFQIHIDIPRTNPLIPLFQQPLVQEVREVLNVLGPSPPVTAAAPALHGCALALPPPLGRFMADRGNASCSDTELWSLQSMSLGFPICSS